MGFLKTQDLKKQVEEILEADEEPTADTKDPEETVQDNVVEKPNYGRQTGKISKKHSMKDKDNYEDWLENELSIAMVDDNILEKVRNKTIVHEVDNAIHKDEVACVNSILEDILNKIINRGDN